MFHPKIRVDTTLRNIIDWEQRRYEIAKEIMAAYNTISEFSRYGIVEKAKMAVEEADALIRALKKYGGYSEAVSGF